ncbi:hypothetical protein N656DRAFT_330074 [Canariomyces notabilis]|uniref:Uncharacterized protein n=1 Tax=Canariomyces notabilis TaxID=2074819 RepID=A0AAN6T9T1_9PEZI|nr:hypothetical protein N656DRAFT_330074 [Canariomyces arenarius]
MMCCEVVGVEGIKRTMWGEENGIWHTRWLSVNLVNAPQSCRVLKDGINTWYASQNSFPRTLRNTSYVQRTRHIPAMTDKLLREKTEERTVESRSYTYLYKQVTQEYLPHLRHLLPLANRSKRFCIHPKPKPKGKPGTLQTSQRHHRPCPHICIVSEKQSRRSISRHPKPFVQFLWFCLSSRPGKTLSYTRQTTLNHCLARLLAPFSFFKSRPHITKTPSVQGKENKVTNQNPSRTSKFKRQAKGGGISNQTSRPSLPSSQIVYAH